MKLAMGIFTITCAEVIEEAFVRKMLFSVDLVSSIDRKVKSKSHLLFQNFAQVAFTRLKSLKNLCAELDIHVRRIVKSMHERQALMQLQINSH